MIRTILSENAMNTSTKTWLSASDFNQRLFAEESLIIDAAEEIWAVMERKGITKTDLAALLGTSKANITQLLNGSRNMTLRTLADISHSLGQKVAIKLSEYRQADEDWEPSGHVIYVARSFRPGSFEYMAANDGVEWQEAM